MKNYQYIILSGFIHFFYSENLVAQRVWGAEISKITSELEMDVLIRVYRQWDSKDSILFNWGDGHVEAIPLSTYTLLGNGFRQDNYLGEHIYDTFGYYEVGFIDSFLIEDIVNIENSGEKALAMFDTVGLFPYGTPFRMNESPKFYGSPLFNVFPDLNGINIPFLFDQRLYEVWEDGYQYKAVPFPSQGYSFPEFSHSFGMENHVLIWDSPITPGTYAICVKVREFRADYLDQYPGDSVLLSTNQRAMIVQIDSSMIVSSPDLWFKALFSVFPNPARDQLHIQYSAPGGPADIRIHDLAGRELYARQLSHSLQLETLDIDVGHWPPGVYLVSVLSGAKRAVRRVAVY